MQNTIFLTYKNVCNDFQIFIEARDSKPSKTEALRSFINAMGEVEMLVGKKWIIMAAENWYAYI
jgi:hypothetical protein